MGFAHKQSFVGSFILVTLLVLQSCGSSTSSSGGGGSGGAGTASVDSLSSVPSNDLSSLDASTSSASIALQKSFSKSFSTSKSESVDLSVGKGLEDKDFRKEGGSSRAGCETNMQKQEIFAASQRVQLSRCYPEAMEKAGMITIPKDSLALYEVIPPEFEDNQASGMCDDIPEFDTKRREGCLEEANRRKTKGDANNIRMRLGIIGGELQIDFCEGGSKNFEGSYSASGSVYTARAKHIGSWQGNTEKDDFSMTVDLGTTGKVTSGAVTLGDGNATATGQHEGGFGSGKIIFAANSAGNTVKGAFKGGFTDALSGKATSFTGKTMAKFNATKGSAKFSFTGAPPPMRMSDMIPFNISAGQLASFLESLSAELGINLTTSNYTTVQVCPNPNFDPESPLNTVKPMVAAGASGCATVTHTGVESFSISSGTKTNDFGGTEVVQTFTMIASDQSPFFTEVNAFDILALLETIDTIAFTRTWDCSGTFTKLDFGAFTPTQLMAAGTALQACFELEEKARNNDGMGGYNCHEQENANAVNDFAKDGPPDFGRYGGDLTATQAGTTCAVGIAPERLFVNPVDPATNQYCIPLDGRCDPITVNSGTNVGTPDSDSGTITFSDTLTFSSFQFDANNPIDSVVIVMTPQGQGSCNAGYVADQPTFTAPPVFGGEGGGDTPGEDGFIPKACKDLGLTTENACRQHCTQSNVDCSV